MTNELKPCPFCGGEPNLYYHDSEIYWTEWYIDCKACGYRMRNKAVGDKAALLEAKKAWNTRQSDFDWKPIEELTKNSLTGETQILLYSKYKHSYILDIQTNFKGEVFVIDNFEDYLSITDLNEEYSHYALLTPPQTNQSNNQLAIPKPSLI